MRLIEALQQTVESNSTTNTCTLAAELAEFKVTVLKKMKNVHNFLKETYSHNQIVGDATRS